MASWQNLLSELKSNKKTNKKTTNNSGRKSYENRYNIGTSNNSKAVKSATNKMKKSIGKPVGLDWND